MYLDLVTITATYYNRAVSYEAYLLTRDPISHESHLMFIAISKMVMAWWQTIRPIGN